MKNVIIDFDNTMGIRGCDVDDGLALLYLLGNPDRVSFRAVCTTYGNSTLDAVQENTERLFSEWHLETPIYRGSDKPNDNAAKESAAAAFLAREAAAAPGELCILATGSTTNLKGAQLNDPRFFQNVASVTLMGGIEKSLVINGRIMDELNFSCDAEATLRILESASEGTPVSIATAQNCLPSFFTRNDFEREFGVEGMLTKAVDYWFSDMDREYEWGGFTCWDVVAAAMLAKPELFDATTKDVTLNRRFLEVGLLEEADGEAPKARIATPRILDPDAFRADVIESWKRGLSLLGIG